MTQPRLNPSNFVRRLSRQKLLLLLETAAECGSLRFLRQAALLWLSSYPGDLDVNFLLASGLVAEGRPSQAQPILEKLCRLDPEFAAAQELLAQITAETSPETASRAQASAHAVSKTILQEVEMPDWIRALRAGRAALSEERLDDAAKLADLVISEEPESILGAILHIQLAAARKQTQAVIDLAKSYRSRWPDCLQFALLLAEAQLNSGDEAPAVILLHHCVVNDAAAQVPEHLWGEAFPYRPLWPEEMEIGFDLPVPADIAARLGWNLLPAASLTASEEMFNIVPPPQVDAADENLLHAMHGRAEIPGGEEPIFPFLQSLLHRDEQQGPIFVENEEFFAQPDQAVEAADASATDEQAPDSTSNPVPEMAAGQGFASAPEDETQTASRPPAKDAPQARTAPRPAESLASVEEQLERLAKRLKKPGLGRADGRYPIYVILTTRGGLIDKYGSNTLAVLEKEMSRLAELVRRRTGWGAMVFYPDDGEIMTRLGLPAITGNDPWKIKLALTDLDQALAKKGQMIGAVLIVGGPEVVPFHNLPNPTDDPDSDIPSDNPYATLDSNYFIQDWPIGRLPGEAGKDAGLLLEQLRQVIRYHNKSAARSAGSKSAIDFWQRVQIFLNSRAGRQASFGYTAAVWRRSSLAVYRQIGDAHSLLASPPQSSGAFHNGKQPALTLAYYNLHGLPDAAEWYGQRDMTDPTPGPDYPVAIAPKDISGKGAMPEVVFSEACYGAHITGKQEEQSMALKFLAQGTLAIVASTVIAYGSVALPLIGADLLGNFFWKRLKAGSTVGEALMQSKIDLVREMNKRQGFLDGEDQKTLISFVLYGDPLISMHPALQSKGVLRQRSHPAVKTICDRQDDDCAQPMLVSQLGKTSTGGNGTSPVSNEVLSQVKALVAEYLPGIDHAVLQIHHQHCACDGKDHTCPTSQMPSAHAAKSPDPDHTVVTIANEIQVGPHIHQQFARVTLDSRGKMLKLAISR